ncbi:MAG TPA: TolC family protein [Sphingobium sp.]|uniref:TolC family protein n=1 Tax=Sphingobium sp. TaxID=1912891 RepID=UPI002ED47D7F
MRKYALLIASILPGCNLAPTYRQPVAPIAPHYPPGTTHGEAPTAQMDWRAFFIDRKLVALIETALERNRDLAQFYARIDQTRAQARVQASQRLPTLEVSGNGTRSRQPLNALGFGGVVPGGGDAPDAIENTQFSTNLGVSAFELDLWVRVRNLAEAERERYLASVEAARAFRLPPSAFRLPLIAQVASTYFELSAGAERVRLAEESLVGRREGLRIARTRLDAGVTSTVDHDQALLLLTQAQTDLPISSARPKRPAICSTC